MKITSRELEQRLATLEVNYRRAARHLAGSDPETVAELETTEKELKALLARTAAGAAEVMFAAVWHLAAGNLADDDMPDTANNATAHRTMCTALAAARTAHRMRLRMMHPASTAEERHALKVRHVRIVTAAWDTYVAATRLAAAGNVAELRHHITALTRLLEAAAGLAELTHQTITTQHTARRTLAPPGRRCVARHLSAQAPPTRTHGVGCTQRATSRSWPQGTLTT